MKNSLIYLLLILFIFIIGCSNEKYFMEFNSKELSFKNKLDDVDNMIEKTYFKAKYNGSDLEYVYFYNDSLIENASYIETNDKHIIYFEFSISDFFFPIISNKITYKIVNGERILSHSERYNDTHALILEEFYNDAGERGKYIEYKVDDSNNVYEKTVTYAYTKTKPKRIEVYAGDELIKRIEYKYDGLLTDSSVEYEKDKIVKRGYYFKDKKHNSLEQELYFDDNKRVVMVNRYFNDGFIKYRRTYNYSTNKQVTELYNRKGEVTSSIEETLTPYKD